MTFLSWLKRFLPKRKERLFRPDPLLKQLGPLEIQREWKLTQTEIGQ